MASSAEIIKGTEDLAILGWRYIYDALPWPAQDIIFNELRRYLHTPGVLFNPVNLVSDNEEDEVIDLVNSEDEEEEEDDDDDSLDGFIVPDMDDLTSSDEDMSEEEEEEDNVLLDNDYNPFEDDPGFEPEDNDNRDFTLRTRFINGVRFRYLHYH